MYEKIIKGIDNIKKMVKICSKCKNNAKCHFNGIMNFESWFNCQNNNIKQLYSELRQIQRDLAINTDEYGQKI